MIDSINVPQIKIYSFFDGVFVLVLALFERPRIERVKNII